MVAISEGLVRAGGGRERCRGINTLRTMAAIKGDPLLNCLYIYINYISR